jgi:hypothetical protein
MLQAEPKTHIEVKLIVPLFKATNGGSTIASPIVVLFLYKWRI